MRSHPAFLLFPGTAYLPPRLLFAELDLISSTPSRLIRRVFVPPAAQGAGHTTSTRETAALDPTVTLLPRLSSALGCRSLIQDEPGKPSLHQRRLKGVALMAILAEEIFQGCRV